MSAEELRAFPQGSSEYRQGKDLEVPYGRKSTAILYGIRDIEDPKAKRVGREIVNRILQNPNIKRVVFMGAPGLGKTIDRNQIRRELVRLSGGRIQVRTVTYDDVLAQCEADWGSREDWTEEDWHRLNEKLAEEASIHSVPGGDKETREVVFVEMVGVGNKQPRDRGVTALELIAKKEQEENRIGQTIYKVFFPDWQTQKHAADMRDEVLSTEADEQVWQVLFNYNVYATGSKLAGKLESTRGKMIKDLLRKSARLEHIQKINIEVIELARQMNSEEKVNFFSKPKWKRILHMTIKQRQNMNLTASYLSSIMENLGIPKEFRYIVVNPYKPKGLTYWFID